MQIVESLTQNPSNMPVDSANLDRLCGSISYSNSLVRTLGGRLTTAVKTNESCGEVEVNEGDFADSSHHIFRDQMSDRENETTPAASGYSKISGCRDYQLDLDLDFITKRIKKTKKITACPHTSKPFYSKGMCRNCYHARGRKKPANQCEHSSRPNYALGLCKNCYLKKYHEDRKKASIANISIEE